MCNNYNKLFSIIIKKNSSTVQRTNLDVNLAVNNLLSRDDEDGEDGDENGGSADGYVPDDLMSLLDSEFFKYFFCIRSRLCLYWKVSVS